MSDSFKDLCDNPISGTTSPLAPLLAKERGTGNKNEIGVGTELMRALSVETRVIDRSTRMVEFSCSSEEPYQRYFGIEVLSHKPECVRLNRLQNAAPVLIEHENEDQVGVITECRLDGSKLRVMAKFSRNSNGEEILNDIEDGIRRNVSIGYIVHAMQLVKQGINGSDNEYLVTDWEPYEVSLVSVPADVTVGIGRSAGLGDRDAERGGRPLDSARGPALTPNPSPGGRGELNGEYTLTPNLRAGGAGSSPVGRGGQEKEIDSNEILINLKKMEMKMDSEEKRALEVKRVADIEALGKRKSVDYQWAIDSGLSIEQFRGYVVDKLGSEKTPFTPQTNIDMPAKERKAYSLARALKAALTNDWREAGLEAEASSAVAKQVGKAARGFFVPWDVMTRDLTATGGGSTGGYVVGTQYQPQNFIDLLSNSMLARQLGARVIPGLSGNVAIARKSAGGTAYWVAEGATVTKSDMTLGQVLLSPKTIGVWEQYSKQLLLQATPAVDQLVTQDLALQLALGIDKAVFHGTGADNQPSGIAVTSGVNSVTGTSFTLATAIEYQYKTEIANAMNGSMYYVTTPTVRGTLKSRQQATNQPVYICGFDNMMAGYLTHATNQISSGYVFFGDFSQILIGEWGMIDIVVDPYSAAEYGLVRVIAHEHVDIAVRQPGAFSMSTSFS